MTKNNRFMICPLCDKQFNTKGILGHILLLHKIKLEKLSDVATFSANIKGFPRTSGHSCNSSIVSEPTYSDTRTSSLRCNASIVSEPLNINTRKLGLRINTPIVSEQMHIKPKISGYKDNASKDLARTGDKQMFPTQVTTSIIKSVTGSDFTSKPVAKTITGSYPAGTDQCFYCKRYFWINEMKPGLYSPQFRYCSKCYTYLRNYKQ